jgi:LemA protein
MMLVVERYPDLKADKSMAALMEELTSTENKISFARQAYNDAVTAYNIQRETFPSNFIANTFNFQEASLFEVTEAVEREAVKVQF